MAAGAETLFAKEQQSQERGLQKKRKDTFHGERLADDAAGGSGEARPVRAELEFHRDAGHDPDGEVDSENPGPEPRGTVVMIIAGAQPNGFQDYDEQRQAHRELREDVVVGNGERKMQAMNSQGILHATPPAASNHRPAWSSPPKMTNDK